MRPDDIALLHTPGTLSLHGDLLLTDVARPDLEANAYRSALWRIPLAGAPEAPKRLTFGTRDSAPRISPDGEWVAFLRVAEEGGKPQLHVMPTTGGDARAVTALPLGVDVPVWAPDSRRIAFVARIPEDGRYGTEEGVTAAKEAPRRFTGYQYRLDNVGFLSDRRPRLFVVDALDFDAEPVQLTDGSAAVSSPAWTADGAHLLVVADRDLDAWDTLHTDIYSVSADGSGGLTLAVRTGGGAEHPVVLPDGDVLYYGIEFEGVHAVARNSGLFRAPLRIGGEPTTGVRLTDTETVDCESGSGAPVPVSGGVLVVVRVRGANELRLVPDGAEAAVLDELKPVLGERGVVNAFTADGDRIAAVVSTVDSPGEVVTLEAENPVVRTDFAAEVRATGLRETVEITGTSPDGYPVHGWLVLPEGEGPHPVLLNVHGGPFRYYGWGFFDEAQVYANAGYAVVLPNPRGSAGYGEAHGRAIIEAMGTVDADDVLALLDAALERPDCDAERVGVMGGSYGGFMASWLAAHHGERFKAAWSERAVNAWDSFTGSSDIGWYFAEAYCGADPEAQRQQSPLYHADKVTIPFAVVHSEEDWRCPIEQAQRQFVALRRNGVAAEFLLFPGEGHELSRSGLPRHREQRFAAVLDWWSRHLV
ncbi:S9 family peptidase [Allokutzneria multivorans]|uniref:S9 family peptidase n=1 Tax=Allokutzneria multivorans TaxID=1142134 RepID=A0ABP7SNY3_9PSEU